MQEGNPVPWHLLSHLGKFRYPTDDIGAVLGTLLDFCNIIYNIGTNIYVFMYFSECLCWNRL